MKNGKRKILGTGEITRLLTALRDRKTVTPDYFAIRLMLNTGLRVSELAILDVRDMQGLEGDHRSGQGRRNKNRARVPFPAGPDKLSLAARRPSTHGNPGRRDVFVCPPIHSCGRTPIDNARAPIQVNRFPLPPPCLMRSRANAWRVCRQAAVVILVTVRIVIRAVWINEQRIIRNVSGPLSSSF